jgi:alpha-1,6-mannosyltransferase
MQLTTRVPAPARPAAAAAPGTPRPDAATGLSPSTRRALGLAGCAITLIGVALLVAFAADSPTVYVPASVRGGFPGWLSGPLHGLAIGRLSTHRFQIVLLLVLAGYVLVLLSGARVPARAVLVAIVGTHLLLLLGPPLLSQDVFGYLSFARLGAVHGLDPYNHASAAVPLDPVYRYLGWRTVDSPYGPLYTLSSYVLAPLGTAGGLWALKAIAVAASLGTAAVVARAAQALGRPPAAAAALVALNPVVLVDAVGGFHNDTLIALLLATVLLCAALVHYGRAMVAVVTAIGIKLSAGLVLPFLVLAPEERRERYRLVAIAVSGLAVLAVLAEVGFGSHAFAFANSIQGEQNMVATHSVPNELARLIGLGTVDALPGWWRFLFALGFVAVVCFGLWRTARGGDWRVWAGWATVALIVSTAWLLPWYVIWALPFAALVEDRRLRAAILALCLYGVLIRLPLASGLLGGRRS